MQAPVIVVNQNSQRETGRKAQLSNVKAGKAVADIIRTTLGPRSMLKMLLDPMGGIVMTNDGHAILREIDVSHPAAKSMIELSRAQDEEVGDGTTSVIILAGEMLSAAEPFLERKMHPTVVVSAFRKALEEGLEIMNKVAFEVDLNDRESMRKIMSSTLGTKFIGRFGSTMCDLALDAVSKVAEDFGGRKEIDIKRYAKIEKIPGGEIEDCKVLNGCMINKDVTHPKMKRRIENPRVLLLDCPLEYKKNESQTMMEFTKEEDFETALRMEEEYIEKICKDIIKFKPDVVITEKGLSDLAQHYFVKAGITALRRLRKTDNTRIARATGATIVNRTDEIRESDIGNAGLFEVRKLGDEYFTFIVDCKDPKACTIVLRGASKDVLNEVERNLQDAMAVARNIVLDPKLVPGGGAIEMTVSQALVEKSKFVDGVQQWPFKAVGMALEVIPRTLAQNCGANVVRTVTELRSKHAGGGNTAFGINGESGEIADMREVGVWEPLVVKTQTFKTAVESACMLLRIDDIVSGVSKTKRDTSGGAPAPEEG